uniref:Uncharacterized protein n=1 Tax=Anguilla anguilla TaxID=7936 RepID=A0A0E9S5P4_ANGAN
MFSPSPPSLMCGERSGAKMAAVLPSWGATHWWWVR